MNASLVWQLLSESLRWKPDHDRLTLLAARQPDINKFQALCSTHGLLPLVDKALGPVRQTLFTPEEAETWQRAVAARILGNLVMHRELERLLQLFAAAQIQIAPFKGPSLSGRLYGDPVLRVCSDLDLLVAPGQVLDVVKLLMAEGYQPEYDLTLLAQQMKPGSREIHFVMKHPSGNFNVELHWLLFCTWQRRKTSPLKVDDWLRADSANHQELLLYLCLHSSLHLWQQMKWVVDIDRCVNTAQDLDWDLLFSTAKSRGCSRSLNLGLMLAVKSCGLQLPEIVDIELRRDKRTDSLAKRVVKLWLQPEATLPSYLWRVRYYLACRDNCSDRLKMMVTYGGMRLHDMRW